MVRLYNVVLCRSQAVSRATKTYNIKGRLVKPEILGSRGNCFWKTIDAGVALYQKPDTPALSSGYKGVPDKVRKRNGNVRAG